MRDTAIPPNTAAEIFGYLGGYHPRGDYTAIIVQEIVGEQLENLVKSGFRIRQILALAGDKIRIEVEDKC